ncbi:MAG TPA: hypothetical protein VGL93_32180 [Streptosporangiaceae bacterium]|jgi:hypothetical protein
MASDRRIEGGPVLVQLHLRLPDRPDALDTLTRAVTRSAGDIVRMDVLSAPDVRRRTPPDDRPRAAVLKLARSTTPADGPCAWRVMADGEVIGTVRAHDDAKRRTRQWTASMRDGRAIPGLQRTRRDAATQLLIEHELSA